METYYILNNVCINKQIPLQTKQEYYNRNIKHIKQKIYKFRFKIQKQKYIFI